MLYFEASVAIMKQIINGINGFSICIFLSNFIREDQIDDFNNFLDRVMEDKNKKLDDIYDRDYSYGTEGYIEFLQTLRNEM